MSKLSRVATKRAVEETVANLLAQSDALQEAPEGLRQSLAEKLIDVSMLAADQIADEIILTERSRRSAKGMALSDRERGPRPTSPSLPPGQPFAQAQAVSEPSMAATAAAGDTIRSIRDAIDFPTYVTSLITGVFQAITTSNIQQLEGIADLLENVSASSSEFTTKNITAAEAAEWAVARFSFLQRATPSESGALLKLRGDTSIADQSAQLKSALKLTDTELGSIDEDSLDDTLLPLVRRAMGRNKQSNLATLVMMGVNRILVDKGQIHASMDMRVDTRSAAEATERSRFDSRTSAGASGGAVGPGWGVAAQASTTVGIVKDNQSSSTEEIASQAGLRSSVDLVFHTEPINLDQMLAAEQRKAIISNSRVPEAKYTTGSILTEQKAKTGIAELSAVPTEAPAAPATPDLAGLASTLQPQGGSGQGSTGSGNLGSRGTAAHLSTFKARGA